MVFSSSLFLFLFLPVFLAAYFLASKSLKNGTLLIFSLIFYTWGENKLVILLLFSTLVDFCSGLLITRGWKKTGLYLSIATNLGLLGFFKYSNFAFENFRSFLSLFDFHSTLLEIPHIALPIGISFFTFQTMSYTIDVYRGNVKACTNFFDFAAYVSMFPQLVAGPIVRYSVIALELKNRRHDKGNLHSGIERFCIGLVKKVVVANSMAAFADDVFSFDAHDLSSGIAWLGIFAYSLQIYFDFSGYSDMAIGLGRMMGFRFLENFNYPYIARNIQDFWRRWHISLSTWFRDYLYISLGGNRISPIRTYINLIIVFFITGLWHGSSWNFVVWGLFHGLFLILERVGLSKILVRLHPIFQHMYLILIVLVGWVFFRADNLEYAMNYVIKMFSFSDGSAVAKSYITYFHYNTYTLLTMVVAIIFSSPATSTLKKFLLENGNYWVYYFLLFLAVMLSVAFISVDSYNPFIYFRF